MKHSTLIVGEKLEQLQETIAELILTDEVGTHLSKFNKLIDLKIKQNELRRKTYTDEELILLYDELIFINDTYIDDKRIDKAIFDNLNELMTNNEVKNQLPSN